MNKFLSWFGRNRTPIGYTVGGVNLLSGISHLLVGNILNGIFWLLIGAAILIDTREFK
jgi:hypothetical protein